MVSSKAILILGIILLSCHLAYSASCGDGQCNGEENCATCSQDCTCKSSSYRSSVTLTYYWITWQDDYPSTNLNTDLKTCTRQNIATVSNDYASKVRMEGTGRLSDGRMINLGSCDCGNGYSCFDLLDATRYPYGMGSQSNPLMPFVSVAANDLPYGKKLYVPQFNGMLLPNGRRHNGCIRVDDTGWSFGRNQIDFFALRESYYNTLDNQMGLNSVTLSESDCALVDYMSNSSTTVAPSASPSAAPSRMPSPVAPSSFPSVLPSALPSTLPSMQPSSAPASNPGGSTVCWSNVYSTIPKAGTVTFSVRYNAVVGSSISVKVIRLSDSAVVGQASAPVTAQASLIALPAVISGTIGSGYVVRVQMTPSGQQTPAASVDYPVSLGFLYQPNSSPSVCRSP